MLKNYLRTAFRNLTRNAATTGLNILGLAVGMTAAILIFLWVDNELTFDSYHRDAGRIYRLTTHYTKAGWVWATNSLPLAQHLDLPAITAKATIKPAYGTTVRLAGELVLEKTGAYVDSGWFSLFHYDFIAGSPSSFYHHPFSLILTQSKAKKYFGDKNPLGQTLHIGPTPYQVAGIIRDNPANSSFQYDILLPIDALLADSNDRKEALSWGNYNFQTFIKLQPGTDPATLGPVITGIMHTNAPITGGNTISLSSLKDIHFETETSNDPAPHMNRKNVYIFSLLGVFLLLIACINYVNLTTARASLRAREIGIRKLVGAGKTSLFSQFLFESLTISILSLVCTLLLVRLALPLFRQLTDTNLRAPFANPETWKIIGGTLLMATLLNGIYPALLLSSFRPLHVLKGAINLKFKDISLRKGLVVLQFTVSIVLIASTVLIQRQLHYIQHTNPGYNRSQLFTFRVPWSQLRKPSEEQTKAVATRIKQQLLTYPAITGVSFAGESIVGMENSNEGSASWDGKDPNFVPENYQLAADENFQNVVGLELRQGRWFDIKQPTDLHNYILNETAINRFNIRRPVLGQRFFFQGDTGRIIGIVKDFHHTSMHQAIGPLVILDRPSWQAVVYIKTAPGKTTQALAAARSVWSQIAPDNPFDYTFLDEAFDNLYKADTRTSTLILLFSVIAILISCLGLLGLAAFTARQRVKEIGIRKVLGATVTNILTLLSRDFIKLVLLSVVVATPIAWWAMHSWLDNFAYHIPLSPWIFAAAGIIALVIAVFTVATQSIRAARANPVKNLRTL
ncbi:MAG TPA: ABC transporter permease [Puia sp.]|nr:ABC transporter permease [Puia sp.]